MRTHRRTSPIQIVAVTALAVTLLAPLAGRPPSPARAATPGLGQLSSQLGQERARQRSLSTSLATVGGLINSLSGQIHLVQSREATLGGELANDRAALARVQSSLASERKRLDELRHRLGRARMLLSRQLVAGYEGDKPDLVSVVLSAHGFNDLLEQVAFLRRAEQQQQTVIAFTRNAKAQADRAARQLATLQATDRQITRAADLRVAALAGMNTLLSAKEGALQGARSAQQAALGASQSRGQRLQSQISQVQAQQAAAARAAQLAAQQAAQRAAQQAAQAAHAAPRVGLGPSNGWSIPFAIVLCESGGQNLPPNSASASGYYQIIASTWKLFGGTGPAAYLASKAEQDAVATRIWNGGAGASNWVCAAIVGIH